MFNIVHIHNRLNVQKDAIQDVLSGVGRAYLVITCSEPLVGHYKIRYAFTVATLPLDANHVRADSLIQLQSGVLQGNGRTHDGIIIELCRQPLATCVKPKTLVETSCISFSEKNENKPLMLCHDLVTWHCHEFRTPVVCRSTTGRS